jgi:hypothetical protein
MQIGSTAWKDKYWVGLQKGSRMWANKVTSGEPHLANSISEREGGSNEHSQVWL